MPEASELARLEQKGLGLILDKLDGSLIQEEKRSLLYLNKLSMLVLKSLIVMGKSVTVDFY
jgi:hypothetical protein